MSLQRHVPVRSCMGCGARDEQHRLLRFVREKTGDIRIDPARSGSGRGGYLHQSPACWRLFAGRKGRVRSFRAAVDRTSRVALAESLERSVDQRGTM